MRHEGGWFFVAESRAVGFLPARVEDAMADIAVIFGWAPAAMYPMSLPELMEWREQARKRSGAEE
ncbi:MAG: GpE family phage tail protein [Nitrosomonadales bacterium]|nr:GpE family phage tail protein [Nitrosomonadales bacterium]